MGLHVIVGSGPVGSAVATELLSRGENVRMVTRRGTGLEGTERVAADAGRSDLMRELSQGAQAIYNCANPEYHRWTQDWPPIANALLAAAESSGAVLAITGNLYGYGPVNAPMTEATPLRPSSVKGRVRVQMWQDALAAQHAGRIRGVTEVRGSDYVGAGPSILTVMVLPRIAAGKTALIPASLDVPHTWTNPADEGRMLVEAATQEKGWGRAWHVPSAPPVSVRELSERAAAIVGIEKVRLMALPTIAVTVGSLFDKMTKEFKEMNYQFRRPFVLDATETSATFGATATPLGESLRENVASYLATV